MVENENEKIELKNEELQEVLGGVPHWIFRWGIIILFIIMMMALLGSSFFRYPDVLSSTMTLTGVKPPVSLVAKTSGKIRQLMVHDKQMVMVGDYLAVIENAAQTSDVLFLKEYLLTLKNNIDTVINIPSKELSLGSMQSLYSSLYIALFEYNEFRRLHYYNQKLCFTQERIEQYEDYYKNLVSQKNIVDDQLKLTNNQFKRDSTLDYKKLISHEDLETAKNRYLQGKLSLKSMYSNLQNTRMQITQLKETLLDTEYQYVDKRNSLQIKLKTYIVQLINEIQAWELNNVLIAPIKGKIVFTNYWSENQNVSAGGSIFNIVPVVCGKLIGKASLPASRSGKVKVGQKVNIRFTSFPDSEFGLVRGVVCNISVVALKNKEIDNYVVEISLPNGLKTTYNKVLPYYPEMQAQADIITDDLSLLDRFFMPLRKLWNEGIRY